MVILILKLTTHYALLLLFFCIRCVQILIISTYPLQYVCVFRDLFACLKYKVNFGAHHFLESQKCIYEMCPQLEKGQSVIFIDCTKQWTGRHTIVVNGKRCRLGRGSLLTDYVEPRMLSASLNTLFKDIILYLVRL